jgi:hypothetical protein
LSGRRERVLTSVRVPYYVNERSFAMYKTSRERTPFDPSIPEHPGWEGMHVHWLADRNHAGAQTTLF